jgi:hypothetical protein
MVAHHFATSGIVMDFDLVSLCLHVLLVKDNFTLQPMAWTAPKAEQIGGRIPRWTKQILSAILSEPMWGMVDIVSVES